MPSFMPPTQRNGAPAAPAAAVRPSPAPGPSMTAAMAAEVEGWRAVLGQVREKRPALASVLEHAALLRFDAERVELGYEQSSFLVGQAVEPTAKELLLAAVRTHFGKSVEVAFETIASKSGTVSVAQIETAERKARQDAARRAVIEHPLVAAAIELLGAELKDVRLAAEVE
jgi:DNA polymerase III subunit gamma/tau